ncbi:pilus assembly protein [Thioalkalivibrio sulfidiphilus]|uniref:pilus assembly protein n=1 Tax=Thioalkalivibrio sulfidiphilus TaxID=1033854 RepID=UPI0003A2CCAC|nr:PilC/PilY family type IV pilus protein [Thioalkalivibrio sulfidiphilus]
MKKQIKFISFMAAAILSVMALFPAASALASINIAQTPLFSGGNVPGNLALVPSVEWPTINSVANLGPYDVNRRYIGYFDNQKCYGYHFSTTEADRHFYPLNNSGPVCAGTNEWSGNFLNWAATQTIDPFRKVLTGGYRVRDTATETWLEKARHDGQGGTAIYPNRRLPDTGSDSILVQGATPFNWNNFQMRIQGLGNRMRFTATGDVNTAPTAYNPTATISSTSVYEVSIRVKVCDPAVGVEDNCRAYDAGWKPEGLIQQYAGSLRYSAFGYLNHSDFLRDGGVLRARKKFVGPTQLDPDAGEIPNPNMEWNPNTGVFITNPDSADASASSTEFSTTISNSGVINYINKFGQMTEFNHKSFDPVSELFYSAIRYFKNQGNVPEYTSMAGATADERRRYADGFPVITNWSDPVQYHCQTNVILGIGDVYTHRDKNLPGNTVTQDEPAMPAAVSADTTVNVVTATNKVAELEGITINTPFTGRENSAYMAGLAYDSNTRDIRPDLPGRQTVSTHWVDVLEAQSLEPIRRNQFWLAAKYGGLKIPQAQQQTFDPYAFNGPIPLEWWHTNGETLTSFGSRGDGSTFPRPDNYYLAGEADKMVEGLTEAFSNIVTEVRQSSASSIATNSTRLDMGTLIYQARFRDDDWTGQLLAYSLGSQGELEDLLWDAADLIPAPSSRNILTRNASGTTVPFTWANLSPSQQLALNTNRNSVVDGRGQQRLDWVRGVRTEEGGLFRERSTVLGSIINSDPHFVGSQNFGYEALPAAAGGGETYTAFRFSKVDSQGRALKPMIYVGANDGMLHGFDAQTGVERFAYMPSSVIPHLSNLTDNNYSHRYLVDGQFFAGDAYIGGQWRTILVGTQGAGGRTVFAIDVTDPHNVTASNVLWEFTHPELGHVLGPPVVGRMKNGQWAAVFGNGYNSDSNTARLFVVNLADGTLIRQINTAVGTSANPNGLAAPAMVSDGSRTLEYAYAGDLHGNLWKFDLTHASNTGQWASAFSSGGNPAPLFRARDAVGNPQPITTLPEIGRHPNGGYMVYFGTGRYFAVGDNIVDTDNPRVQSFYGIWDNGNAVGAYTSRSERLQEQTIIYEGPTVLADGGDAAFASVRAVSNDVFTYNATTRRGWFIDLLSPVNGFEGERVISTPILRAGRIIFPTLMPDPDPCAFGGSSWLMEMDALSGARLDYSVFDMNQDGEFSSGDYITIIVDGEEIQVPVSGIRSEVGIIKDPAIISAGEREYKFASGSSGEVERIVERGTIARPRGSWRQIR